jgi:hypothetical protein
MGGGTNNNLLKAIRGSEKNGGGSSGDGGKGNANSDSNQDGDSDSTNADPDALRTPPETIFAPLSALAE